MGLSCVCDYDCDDCEWMYGDCSDYKPMPLKRSTRCCSCGQMIKPGNLSIAHLRSRWDGEKDAEISLAPHWHCESCGDIFLNLEAAGFCISPSDDMRALKEEYDGLHREAMNKRYDKWVMRNDAPLLGCLDASVEMRAPHADCKFCGAWNCAYCYREACTFRKCESMKFEG